MIGFKSLWLDCNHNDLKTSASWSFFLSPHHNDCKRLEWATPWHPPTMSIILSPSRSLQLRFFSLWASSMTTHRHGTLRSSGQSVRIISKVVITAWNRYAPLMILPWGDKDWWSVKESEDQPPKSKGIHASCCCHGKLPNELWLIQVSIS